MACIRAAETIKVINLRQIQDQPTGPLPSTETGAVPHARTKGFLGVLKSIMSQPSSSSPSTRKSNRLLQMADEKDDFVADKNLGQCSLRKGFLLEKLFSAVGEPIDLARLVQQTDAPDAPDADSAAHDFTLSFEWSPENQVRVYLPAEAMCGQISHVRIREKSSPDSPIVLDLSHMADLPPFEAARQIASFLRHNYIYSLNPKVKNSWLPVFTKPLPLPERIAFLNRHQKGQCAVFANVLCEIMNTLHPTVQWIPAAGREIKNGHFNTSGHAVLLGVDHSGEWRIFDATPETIDQRDRLTQRQMRHWDSLSALPSPHLNVNHPIHPNSYKNLLRDQIYNAHAPKMAAKILEMPPFNKMELLIMILQDLKTEQRWKTFKAAAEAIFEKDFSMCATRKTFAAEILQSSLDMFSKDGDSL